MTTTTQTIYSDCSGCRADIKVNVPQGIIFATRPSNGVRGRGHEAARLVSSPVFNDGDLLTWDCPLCGYADSYDLTQED